MSKKKNLVDKFMASDYFIPYSNDPEIISFIYPALSVLEDVIHQQNLDLHQGYLNQQIIGYFLTDMLPKEAPIFPDESIYIYDGIIDFYYFLYGEKIISLDELKNMLFFFQTKKAIFYPRMFDEDVWSNDKLDFLNEFDDQAYNDLSPEEKAVFEKLNALFLNEAELPKPAKKKKGAGNNVIQFPGTEKKKVSKPKATSTFLRFRIDLIGFKPPIWRRVLVPDNINFDQFHQVIQALFEWKDYHLYQFEGEGLLIEKEPEEDTFDLPWNIEDQVPSEDITLKEFFHEVGQKMEYVYDFGDWWEHKIVLEAFETSDSIDAAFHIDAKTQLPYCVKGRQDAPEEDSHYEETFVPFDIDAVNSRLSHLQQA